MKKLLLAFGFFTALVTQAFAAGIDANTVLMLHCDGTNGSTTFTDSETTPKTATAVGNVQISTAQGKFGGASCLFDGTGDYITFVDSVDWYFGTGDFTIDLWFRVPSGAGGKGIVSQLADSSNEWRLFFNPSVPYTEFDQYAGGTLNVNFNTFPAAMPIDTWIHYEVSKSSNVYREFINGVQEAGSVTDSDAINDLSGLLRIGFAGSSTVYMNGYLDEIRISKGVARHTANFTPETTAYSAGGGGPAPILRNQVISF